MPISISRRTFVGMAVAAVTVGGTPVPAGAAEEYGFSVDGEIYQTGFASGEAAAEVARTYGGGSAFQVARIVHRTLEWPSEAGEMVVDHLINDRSIGFDVLDWLANANEEGDYEGDFSDACHRIHRADRTVVDVPARAAVSAALLRAGDPGAAARVAGGDAPGNIPDGVLDAIATDPVLGTEMDRLVRAFVERNDLAREIRGLDVHDLVPYPAAEAA